MSGKKVGKEGLAVSVEEFVRESGENYRRFLDGLQDVVQGALEVHLSDSGEDGQGLADFVAITVRKFPGTTALDVLLEVVKRTTSQNDQQEVFDREETVGQSRVQEKEVFFNAT